MRRWVVLAVGALGFGGCVAGPVGGFTKAGVSEEERIRDQDECQQRALETSDGSTPSGVRYERCMRAKGYWLGER